MYAIVLLGFLSVLRDTFRRLLARRCITFDNGSEFARQQNLSQTLDMKTWFS